MAKASWESPDQLGSYRDIKPLWSIDYKQEGTLLTWTNSAYQIILDNDGDRIEAYRENLGRFRGSYRQTEPLIGGRNLSPAQRGSNPRLIVNHTQDLTEQKVSALSKFKPQTTVVPPSPELADKLDSIIADEVLFSLKYDNDLDGLYAKMFRMAFLGGESYIFPFWDEFKGDLHPDWKTKEGEDIPLLDKEGEQVKNANGKPVFITQPQYIGDVSYRIRSLENVRLCPARSVREINYIIEHDWIHIDELRKDYPDKEFKADEKASEVSAKTQSEEKLENHVLVMTVTHRSHRHLANGLYYKCTPVQILDAPRDNPRTRIPSSDWDNLPCRRIVDVDQEDSVFGFPSNTNIAPMQNVHDKLTTICVKNLFWASHLKWFAIQNSVDKAQLTNDSCIVWVKPGQTFPVAQTFQAFGADVFNFRASTVEDMEKIYGIFSVSRGAPPPGTRAAASLYFYDEQEQQRRNNLQKKINRLIVDVDRMTLSIVADNYRDHDKRLINILGKTKEWMVKKFKVESLRKSFDIRIENTPNLPDSRYARLQYLTQLQTAFPGIVTAEQVGDLIDLGNTDRFITPTRVARFAAESENDSLLRGDDVADPEAYEDQIVHWQTHMKEVQSPDYKSYPDSVREEFEAHIKAHEMIMDDLAQESQAFAQQVTVIPQFPVFFKRQAPPAAAPELQSQQAPPPTQPSPEPSPMPLNGPASPQLQAPQAIPQ